MNRSFTSQPKSRDSIDKAISARRAHVAGPRRTAGVSRWRALGREQFRLLIELPDAQGRSEGGSKPC